MKLKLFLFLILAMGLSQHSFSADDSMAGTYRCWSFNVGGAGKRCTSPALVLKENGQYTMGSEKGMYKMKDGKLMLSQSKIRGAGRFQEKGNQIVFQYTYLGLSQTVTYLRQDRGGASSAKRFVEETRETASAVVQEKKDAPPVNIDVTIIFPDSGNVGWINGAAIIEEGETTGPETLANNDGKNTVTTYFRSMPSGRVYKIYVTTGFEKRYVGIVDLRNVTEDVKVKLYAK